jgi:hypothetical protein
MTETRTESLPAIPVGQAIGQAVGQAQAVLTGLLASVVAETGTRREAYLALQRLAGRGGAAGRDSFVRDLGDALGMDLWAAGELADSMVAEGLLTSADGTIRLADPGAALRARIGDSIGALTAPVFGPLDPADVAATLRTLQEITTRARAARAAGAPAAGKGEL